MADGFWGQTYIAFSNIGLNIVVEDRLVIFFGHQLLCLVHFEMLYKRIIVVTTYHFGTNNFWDVWEASVLKHSLVILLALQ